METNYEKPLDGQVPSNVQHNNDKLIIQSRRTNARDTLRSGTEIEDSHKSIDTKNNKGRFERFAPHIYNCDYAPLPIRIGKKSPAPMQWQSVLIDQAQVNKWCSEFPNHGIGIRTGELVKGTDCALGAIDMDILYPEVAECVDAIIQRHFAPRGTLMKRIGEAPKALYPVLSQGMTAKFVIKLTTPPGKNQITDSSRRSHQPCIEWLGKGQQFVASGIHPKTNEKYIWPESNPANTPSSQLAQITVERFTLFLTDLTAALKDLDQGWVVDTSDFYQKTKSSANAIINGVTQSHENDDWDFPIPSFFNPDTLTKEKAQLIINESDLCPDDYHDAIKIQSIWHDWDDVQGKGEAIISLTTKRYPLEKATEFVKNKWGTLSNDKSPSKRITFATPLHQIKQKRATPKTEDECITIFKKYKDLILNATSARGLRGDITTSIRQSGLPKHDTDALAQCYQSTLKDKFGMAWTIKDCRENLRPEVLEGELVESPAPSLMDYANVFMESHRMVKDENDNVYCRLDTNAPFVAIDSNAFKTLAINTVRKCFNQALSAQNYATLIGVVKAFGIENAPVRRVAKRNAKLANGAYAIHLGDNTNSHIVISANNGVTLDSQMSDEIIFIPPASIAPYPTMVDCIDPNCLKLFKHINVPKKYQPHVIAWMLATFMEDVVQPILLLTGAANTGKSTAVGLINKIINPTKNKRGLLTLSVSVDNLSSSMNQNHVIAFDNVTTFSKSLSTFLCTVVTGSAFEKRALYSNSDTHMIQLNNPIMVSAISNPVTEPDLAERYLTISLEPLASIKSEKKRSLQLEKDIPVIFAGLLQLGAQALTVLPGISQGSNYRLVDFIHLGRAVNKVLNIDEEFFEKHLLELQNTEKLNALDSEPVLHLLQQFMFDRHRDGWEGTSANLLDALRTSSHVYYNSRELPKSGSVLIAIVNKNQKPLSSIGIDYTRLTKRQKNTRLWRFTLNGHAPERDLPSIFDVDELSTNEFAPE